MNAGFSILFLVSTFHFWLTLNKHKKAWETVFRRYVKTIFAFEELLKNHILLSGGMMRLALDVGTKRTCTRGLFDKEGYVVFRNVGSITGWDVVEKPFLNGLGV